MSPWSKPLEVERLADAAADVDFDIPLAELSGLRVLQTPVGGSVSGRVHFGREGGIAVAELDLRGTATLKCQRCLQPMQRALEVHAKIALIASEADAARVPGHLEPVLAEGGRSSSGALVTEELLLTLPIVPLHAGECAAATATAAAPAAPAGGETHRPFARLGELLKR